MNTEQTGSEKPITKRHALAVVAVLSVAFGMIVYQLNRPLDAKIEPQKTIDIDGRVRHYRIVIPDRRFSTSVVFAFHGVGDSTKSMATYSKLDWLAAKHGFILVYPEAENQRWNTEAIDIESNDDLKFFEKLSTRIQEQFSTQNNYLVGMSNGATFAQLAATIFPEEASGVVAHSGPRPKTLPRSEKKWPILLIVGEDDLASGQMKADGDDYQRNGHDVAFEFVPGLGHEWAANYNSAMWSFKSSNR